jgi:hypothetical protein
MGNARNADEFFTHFGYFVKELYRVLKPGRLVSFHCMDLPLSKATTASSASATSAAI